MAMDYIRAILKYAKCTPKEKGLEIEVAHPWFKGRIMITWEEIHPLARAALAAALGC